MQVGCIYVLVLTQRNQGKISCCWTSALSCKPRVSQRLVFMAAVGYVVLLLVNAATQTGLFGDDNGGHNLCCKLSTPA